MTVRSSTTVRSTTGLHNGKPARTCSIRCWRLPDRNQRPRAGRPEWRHQRAAEEPDQPHGVPEVARRYAGGRHHGAAGHRHAELRAGRADEAGLQGPRARRDVGQYHAIRSADHRRRGRGGRRPRAGAQPVHAQPERHLRGERQRLGALRGHERRQRDSSRRRRHGHGRNDLRRHALAADHRRRHFDWLHGADLHLPDREHGSAGQPHGADCCTVRRRHLAGDHRIRAARTG